MPTTIEAKLSSSKTISAAVDSAYWEDVRSVMKGRIKVKQYAESLEGKVYGIRFYIS